MSQASPLSLRGGLGVLLLVAVRVAFDLARWATSPPRYWNWEEAYNAGVAWYVAFGGLGDQLLQLQYKLFCGGCTVVAGVGAGVFTFAGDSALAWKSIALAWTAATLLTAFWALRHLGGPVAGWAGLVLLAFPPLGASDAALMLWGNHAESALPVLLALGFAASARPLLAGLFLGLAVWFCRSALYAVPMVALVQASPVRFLVGLVAGLSPALLPAGAGDQGTYALSPWANFFPEGWREGLRRAQLLVDPRALEARLFPTVPGMLVPTTAWVLGLGAVAVAAEGVRSARGVLAGALVWILAFAAVSFPVPDMRTAGPVVNLRYHAPWFLITTLLAAVAFGGSVARGGWRRWVAGLGAAAMLGAQVGGVARAALKLAPGEHLREIPAVSLLRFAWVAAWRLDDPLASPPEDARARRGLEELVGYRAAARVARDGADWSAELAGLPSTAAVEAYAQALTDPQRAWRELEASGARLDALDPALAAAYGRGMAVSLGFGVSGGAPPLAGVRPPVGDPRAPENLRARAEDLLALSNRWTTAAVGAAVMDGCRQGEDPAAWGRCLAAVLDGELLQPDVLWGAGRACPRPAEAPALCRHAGDVLGMTTDAEPFLEGVDAPGAGADRPFTLAPP